MADIKIDTKLFQERTSHFLNAWKADKRSGDALFGGVSSILIMMGKVDSEPEFHKNNAMHVCRAEFDLERLRRECDRVLTTAKIVLAPGIRIPDDAHALNTRHHLYPHNAKERFEPLRSPLPLFSIAIQANMLSQPNISTKLRAGGIPLRSLCEARTPPRTKNFS